MTSRPQRCAACHQAEPIFPFTMAFQPIVDARSNRIVAHEALVRGRGGDGAATVLSQITDENVYAFDQACRVKAIEMAAALGLTGGLSINFLPRAVYEPKACIRQTLAAAARTGFPLNQLTFEIVEHEQITDIAHIRSIIDEYRRLGFKIALDDFGMGYSSLARLAALEPDVIKLDRELISDCDMHEARLTIVARMVSLTDQLGVRLVAEGVERQGEVEALRSVGVRLMQGYYFSRPIFQGFARPDDINWPEPTIDIAASAARMAAVPPAASSMAASSFAAG
jgi:EAL domain-containing protein (putative c-di-GMP-specific phosphodiesterase class I)